MNKFTKLAIAAAAVVIGSGSAVAAPVLTLTVTQAGATSGSGSDLLCAGAGGVHTGTTCTLTSTTGAVSFVSPYGDFDSNVSFGLGNGSNPSSMAQPGLWLLNNSATTSAASITITLTAQGYDNPTSPFPLLSTLSGTNGNNVQQTVSAFIDDTDSGVAGAGVLLLSESFSDFGSISGDYLNDVTYSGSYSLSWILTVERLVAGGSVEAGGLQATHTQALPVPGPLALLGLGLMGVGFLRRKSA